MNRLLCTLLGTAALAAPMAALGQTEISEDRNTTVRTSTEGDVTINSGVTITPAEGSGLVVDSDNDASVAGQIRIEDRDDATGIEIESGNAGDVELSGTVIIIEDFAAEDLDDDGIADTRFAQGSGRTGILISGADTFTGNISTTASSGIQIEGNESYGIRLASGADVVGDMSLQGQISLTGDRSTAIAIEGGVTGDVEVGGTIQVLGEDSQSVVLASDIDGGFSSSASITNTGFRIGGRQPARIRDLLDEDDQYLAGAAVQISGNVTGGIFFREVTQTTVNSDGSETTTVLARSNLNQSGSAPAVLVDGNGTPLAIGVVAEITDVSDPDFDAEVQYAFVNQGNMVASGVFDDFNATVFEARNATFEGGISNTGSLTATAFRSGDDGTDDEPGATGLARVIVLGDDVIAERINNSGIILATVSEAADTIYADRDNILSAREIRAVAIDIAETAQVAEFTNSGTISAVITGRDGEAVVLRDASGNLSTVTNSGVIQAAGVNSDQIGQSDTDFNLIAIDVSANTLGVSISQSQDDTLVPFILGDILLGSGDDTVTSTAGAILGGIDFGAGNDTFEITDTDYLGQIRDEDGTLTLRVTNGTFSLAGSQPLQVAEATFDGDATFIASIDGQAGTASTLVSSGALTVGEDVTIRPVLEGIVGASGGPTQFALLSGAQLNFAPDLETLRDAFSPFLYDTVYTLDATTNTLFVELSLRSPEDLGLSTLQGSAFDATFDALGANTDLARAIVNIDNGESFDAARRGQAQPGGFWIQEFFYYADRERAQLAEQYRGQGFGFTGGFDTALGPFHAVGVSAGFASTEIEDTVGVDEPLDVTTAQFGLYAGLESGALGIDAYAGLGLNEFDSNRRIEIGDYTADSSGEWSGMHYNASLRAGYDVALGKRFWARPSVSLDYLSLTEDAYSEDGPIGVAFDIDERTVDTAAVTALLNFGAEFSGKRTWVRPSVRVGYRNEFVGDVITTGNFRDLTTPFSIEAAEFPDAGLLLGLSILAGSDYSSFGVDLDTDIRDGFIRTTGRVVVRVLF